MQILQNVAYTLQHCQKISVIHGNLRAKNIFVDNDDKTDKLIYYIGGFHHAVMAKYVPLLVFSPTYYYLLGNNLISKIFKKYFKFLKSNYYLKDNNI